MFDTIHAPFFKMSLSYKTKHGYKQPILALYKGKTQVYTKMYNNDDSYVNPFSRFNIILNTTHQLTMQQRFEGSGKYVLRLFVDGQEIGKTVNTAPLTFSNLGVFHGQSCFCEKDGSLESFGRLWD